MQLRKKENQSAPRDLVFLLNQLMANAIHLKLQAKNAHWNIRGSNFAALHLLFDQVATIADEHTDLLAERAVQLGGYAMGGLEDIRKRTELIDNAEHTHASEQHIKALADSLKICVACSNHAIDSAVSFNDQITADLLTEISRTLDKQRWLVESNLSS